MTSIIGFKGMPRVTAVVRRKPAPAVARPATVGAASIEYDEEGRRIMTAPLQPPPRPAPTVLHLPPGAVGWDWKASKWIMRDDATPAPAKKEPPQSAPTSAQPRSTGVSDSRRLKPAVLSPDDIPF